MAETYQQAMARAKANANRDGNRRYVHCWGDNWYVGHWPCDNATVVEPDDNTTTVKPE